MVWIAKAGPDGPQVWEINDTTVTSVKIGAGTRSDNDEGGLSFRGDLFGGWFGSQDLWLQEPTSIAATGGDVNKIAVGAGLGADYALGPVVLGAGVDLTVPIGGPAVTGNTRLPIRPFPHVRVGVPVAQLTVGWTFPWYPTVGAIGAIPLGDLFELRPRLAVGLPSTWDRTNLDWIGWGTQHNDCDFEAWEILLERKVSIDGDEDVKIVRSESKEFPRSLRLSIPSRGLS